VSRRGEKAEMNPEPHLFSYIRIEEKYFQFRRSSCFGVGVRGSLVMEERLVGYRGKARVGF